MNLHWTRQLKLRLEEVDTDDEFEERKRQELIDFCETYPAVSKPEHDEIKGRVDVLEG
jgi:predicted DNA binding CopG/RHH family protein